MTNSNVKIQTPCNPQSSVSSSANIDHTLLASKPTPVVPRNSKEAKELVVERVRDYIFNRLPEGTPTAEGAASELAISKRTLQRYLNVKQTTFKAILDTTRKSLAHAYLVDGVTNVGELTYRLGFADASSFCRAFKRWYGCSTGKYLSMQIRKDAAERTAVEMNISAETEVTNETVALEAQAAEPALETSAKPIVESSSDMQSAMTEAMNVVANAVV